ncbi:Dihydropteroate synthase [Planctomycetes bacterium Pla163]|uniref:dihydropteroate synthase n=1 Tax=Rohdeia mirabilis TaxID=2528008 RepID=A0A518D1Y9_9BACT|nr:Dihydropteroate synthase [Planctomycetes bacterium Pla163]
MSPDSTHDVGTRERGTGQRATPHLAELLGPVGQARAVRHVADEGPLAHFVGARASVGTSTGTSVGTSVRIDALDAALAATRAGADHTDPELAERVHLARVRAAARSSRPSDRRPAIWGVLNVTPDSFSDGGRWADPALAVERGLALEAEGADVIDVGGESTRPGADPVDAREEARRVLPVITALAAALGTASISIDTLKADVARRAVDAGASWINDPSGGDADAAMLDAAATSSARYVCMHMRGTPRTMQRRPHFDDAVGEVCEELRAKLWRCLEAGIEPERLWADPGLGFGKRLEDNLDLMGRLGELTSLGVPLLVGASRKSFVGALSGVATPNERLAGSLAAATLLAERGASALRVHDVAPTAQALDVARGILGASRPCGGGA